MRVDSQLLELPPLEAGDLAGIELGDGDGELDQGLDAGAEAAPDVVPADGNEDVLAAVQVQDQDVVQTRLLLAAVKSVSCVLVHIDLIWLKPSRCFLFTKFN